MVRPNRSRQILLLVALQDKANQVLATRSTVNFRYMSRHMRNLQALIDNVNAEFPGSITVEPLRAGFYETDIFNLVNAINVQLDVLVSDELESASSASTNSSSS